VVELRNESSTKVSKNWEVLGLIVAIGNLLSMVIFTTYLPKQLSERGITRGAFW
ncbi:8333_t:CDS:1, partial [Paraglomus occultum]